VPVAALPSNAGYLKQVDLVADRLDNMIITYYVNKMNNISTFY
jgi:molybdopterin/thiamine biosynthesis adenylyltransferase